MDLCACLLSWVEDEDEDEDEEEGGEETVVGVEEVGEVSSGI